MHHTPYLLYVCLHMEYFAMITVLCYLILLMFDYRNRVLTSKLKPSFHLSCYVQLITRDSACNMLPIVQAYENLLSA